MQEVESKGCKKLQHNCYLPELIVSLILSRLPVRSLLRFKTVCKSWHHIISSPYFINAHLQQAKEANNFMIIKVDSFDHVRRCNVEFHKFNQGTRTGFQLMEAWFRDDRIWEVQHCNGLLLFQVYSDHYICNPATREIKILPVGSAKFDKFEEISLGYDPQYRKHKVVRTFASKKPSVTFGVCIEVLTLGTDTTWRKLDGNFPYQTFMYGDTASVDGALFWMGYYHKGNDDGNFSWVPRMSFILLDLKCEKVKLMALPPFTFENTDDACFLQIARGTLYFFNVLHRHQYEARIWTMKDWRDGSWNVSYTLNLQNTSLFISDYLQLVSVDTEKILFIKDEEMYQYTLTSGEYEIVVDQQQKDLLSCHPRCKNIYGLHGDVGNYLSPYVESLLPIDSGSCCYVDVDTDSIDFNCY